MSKTPIPKLPHSAIRAVRFPIVTEPPASICQGIGEVVSAHAVLENEVFELLVALTGTKHPVGRVAFRYQGAAERFKTCRTLLILHGISLHISLKKLYEQIDDCCKARDQFAHGVWIKTPTGEVALRLTKGEYETKEGGIADRSFVPQASTVPEKIYSETRQVILTTAKVVQDMRIDVAARLQKLHAVS